MAPYKQTIIEHLAMLDENHIKAAEDRKLLGSFLTDIRTKITLELMRIPDEVLVHDAIKEIPPTKSGLSCTNEALLIMSTGDCCVGDWHHVFQKWRMYDVIDEDYRWINETESMFVVGFVNLPEDRRALTGMKDMYERAAKAEEWRERNGKAD